MTTDHPQDSGASAAIPPPECPAHTSPIEPTGPGGLHRLYGPAAEADPMGLYEKLRKLYGAVAPVLVRGDHPAWLVLGYRENLHTMRETHLFTRDPRAWREVQEGKIGHDHPLAPLVAWKPLCNLQDGLAQMRLRQAITDSLQYDRYGLRSYVTRFANELINEFCRAGTADLVEQYARRLPLRVVTQLLGMGEEKAPQLMDAVHDMMSGSPTAVAANNYITKALEDLAGEKAADRDGRYDIVTWLLKHEQRLEFEEVVEHARLILVAANATTQNLISSTLVQVLTNDDFRNQLAGGYVTLPDLVEHTLRVRPPFSTVIGRYALTDTHLGSQHIKAGDLLINCLAAANVDPDCQPGPEQRIFGNSSHLSHSAGPHECPGQDIGRAITTTAVEVLLDRLPTAELSVDKDKLKWGTTEMSTFVLALPVRFEPAEIKSRALARSRG